eukprot:TRINITY_DN3931_c0_g1_i6.p1 TRINITY_DN3931_c0_g1~~TRINITY_DN3931_c0_g1_i6.p1  ORF type:complete len:277 (+),score=25.24 TRINITY_DN3931_c0_g1_i6:104-934(+)
MSLPVTNVDVHLIGAKDLKNTKVFSKMKPVAIVGIYGTNLRQPTQPSKDGGASPTWNEKFAFPVDDRILANNPLLVVELYDSPSYDKPLGVVQVPLLEAVRRHGQQQNGNFQVIRNSSTGMRNQGYVQLLFKVDRPSFAENLEKETVGEWLSQQPALNPPQQPSPQRAAQNPYVGAPVMGGVSGAPYPYAPAPPAYGAPPAYAYPQQPAYYPPPPAYPGYPGHPGYYPQAGPSVVVMDRGYGRSGYGGGMGGLGMGMLAGGLGGLLVGDMIFDGGF